MRLTQFSLLFLILLSFVQCDKTSPEEVKNPAQEKISDSLKKVEEKEKEISYHAEIINHQDSAL